MKNYLNFLVKWLDLWIEHTWLIFLNNTTKEKREIAPFAAIVTVFYAKNQRYLKKNLEKTNLILLILGKYRTTEMIQVFWPFFQNIKMNSIVEVKYSVANNAGEPKKVTAGSAG